MIWKILSFFYLIYIYRILHKTVAEYMFFSSRQNITKVDHTLGYKTSLNNLKMIQVMQSIFSIGELTSQMFRK